MHVSDPANDRRSAASRFARFNLCRRAARFVGCSTLLARDATECFYKLRTGVRIIARVSSWSTQVR